MKGYIQNNSSGWRHAMKRSIGPGHTVPLDELFEQYGIKHELEEGRPFVDWLRSVKLRNKSTWKIIYEDENSKDQEVDEVVESSADKKSDLPKPLSDRRSEVENVVSMPVRIARDKLKTITNIKVLKYALNEANQLSGKETLCKMLRKRIGELELTRR